MEIDIEYDNTARAAFADLPAQLTFGVAPMVGDIVEIQLGGKFIPTPRFQVTGVRHCFSQQPNVGLTETMAEQLRHRPIVALALVGAAAST
jgi:hypothetical protein